LQTEEDEVAAIREALRTAGGNKTKAAKLLGVHRKTIYRKIEKYKALL
jgi:transcriptional regulator with PAS, ATPase and Fis domain